MDLRNQSGDKMAEHEQCSVQVEFPAYVLQQMSAEEVRRLAQEALFVRLYEQGQISSGRAGALLGMTRSDFLDLLGRYGVSYFDEGTDLEGDLQAADHARG